MQINEIFSSIDGEGIRTGYLTTFIRSFGCNLSCSYCDTVYACVVDKNEQQQFTTMNEHCYFPLTLLPYSKPDAAS